MQFVKGKIYHVYNRGNNKQRIFFKAKNYLYFIEKMKKYICVNGDLLAWTLMPNHFHFLIHANADTCRLVKHTPIEINALTEGIRLMLSSYAKGIQQQEGLTGNLFQQKTKSKCANDQDYASAVFHYIHQNAYRAGLVYKAEQWRYSSLPEYGGLNAPSNKRSFPPFKLCNTRLACECLDLNLDRVDRSTRLSAAEEWVEN
jgi:REP element-mobilizing transposase RayT